MVRPRGPAPQVMEAWSRSLDRLAERLLAFGQHYRHLAQPFKWTFTRADLDALLARLSRREPHLRPAA